MDESKVPAGSENQSNKMTLEFKTGQIDAQSILGHPYYDHDGQARRNHGPVVRRDIRIHSTKWSAAGRHASGYLPRYGGQHRRSRVRHARLVRRWEGTERIRAGELPAGTMAMVTHMGPYDNLGETWNAACAMDRVERFPARTCTLGSVRHRSRRPSRDQSQVAHRHFLSRAGWMLNRVRSLSMKHPEEQGGIPVLKKPLTSET